MQRTFLLIPHEIAGLPVFGVGWLLALLIAILVIRLAIGRLAGPAENRPSPIDLLKTEGLMWAALMAGIVFVLPAVELKNLDDEPVGMAIRGYGVFLLAGVSAGYALAVHRARRRGIGHDVIMGVAPWLFFGGIIGARLFFVIQYRDQFIGETLGQTLGNMARFTEGGLVVYGSFIGGFVAIVLFAMLYHVSLPKLGDVIVPCVFLGVFFGRIGCLMNGCCYGGRCEDGWSALHFPPNSPVYQDQLRSGELIGFTFDPESRIIKDVREGSLAAQAGIQTGGKLEVFADDLTPLETASREIPKENARTGVIVTVDGRRHRWSPEQLPARALPVHAAQLLSSLSSLALCLGLCAIPALKFRDGTVMLVGFAGYAVVRFALEVVRVDEGGQFGTMLSISQWVSIVVLVCSVFGLWWIHRTPRPAPLQPQPSQST